MDQIEIQTSVDLEKNQEALKDSGEFTRIEDKYLIRKEDLHLVLKLLYSQMEPKYLDNTTQYTLIESIYFDSDNLDFYQHHFSNMESRNKLRVRRYAPNGIWSNGPVQIELKVKKLGLCKKRRFQISQNTLKDINEGKLIEVNKELILLNLNMKEDVLEKRVRKVNKLITKYAVKGSMGITYHRLAFEKDNFRATVDSNLEFVQKKALPDSLTNTICNSALWPSAMKLLGKYQHDAFAVLELKHDGSIPAWMVSFLESSAIKKTSFSKYGWSWTDVINKKNELLKLPN